MFKTNENQCRLSVALVLACSWQPACGVDNEKAWSEAAQGGKALSTKTFQVEIDWEAQRSLEKSLRDPHYFLASEQHVDAKFFYNFEKAFEAAAEEFKNEPAAYQDESATPIQGRKRMYAKSDDNLIIRENGVTTVHINGLHGFALTNSAAKSPAAPDSVITHFLAQHIANAASILPAEYFIEKLVNCRNQENVRFRFRVGVNVFEITREANAEPITLSAPPHQDFSNGVVAATVVGDQEGGFVFPPHTYDVHRFDKFDRQNKPVNPSFVAKLLSHSSGHNFFIVDDRFPTEDRVGFAHAGGRIEKDIERSKKEGTPERVRLIVLTFKPPLANG